MNRVHLASIVFSLVLLIVLFNYIYVRSVQDEMLPQIELLSSSYTAPTLPDEAENIWNSRKRLLSLTVPLTAIEKIDIQFSEIRACAESRDSSAYLSACYGLSELISALGS